MAITRILTDNPLATHNWSKRVYTEVSKALKISPLISTTSRNVIQELVDTGKSGGDGITFALRAQLMGAGVTEGQVLEGNEESLQFLNDRVTINELRHAARVPNNGTIDQQRFITNLREQAREGLVDWYADRISLMFFLQVCGYTAKRLIFEGREQDILPVHYGFNEPQEASDLRIIRPEDKTKDEDLTDAGKHKFTLTLIDKAVQRAKLANPQIRPIRVGNDDVYVLYLHPTQVMQMRTNTDAGQWIDIHRSIYATTRQSNPFYSGALGMYNGVVLREHEHVTPGVKSTDKTMFKDVRRAVFLGAQSAVIAYGKDHQNLRYKMVDETFDYENQYGLSVQTLIGLKKTQFKTPGGKGLQDYATIVIPTYAKDV